MLPLPDVTKNLIIINVLMFLAQLTIPAVTTNLAVYSPFYSDNFQPYQLVTYMFLHSPTTFMHIFFNMFALYSFGRDIEYSLGAKKFLFLYLASGIAAITLQLLVQYIEMSQWIDTYGLAQVQSFANKSPTLGASGSVFGLLAAFGMLYPNRVITLLIPPIPMKAKYFVMIFAALELYMGVSGSQRGVAHFAHLGGAIFAAIMILIWRKRGERF